MTKRSISITKNPPPKSRRRQTPASKRFLKSIGHKLYDIRVAKKLKLEDAAGALRMSVTRLSAIEQGEKNYSLELLVRMCDYFDVDVLEVVGD